LICIGGLFLTRIGDHRQRGTNRAGSVHAVDVFAVCAQCGVGFLRPPWQRLGRRTFCTIDCFRLASRCYRVDEAVYRGRYREIERDGERAPEHRRIMEELLGRKLEASEHVHHINGNSLDNRPENLRVMGAAEHLREHATLSIDVEALKAMYANGLSLRAISKETGHHRNTVRGRLVDAGVIVRDRVSAVVLACGGG
jgi:hypothetical protein